MDPTRKKGEVPTCSFCGKWHDEVQKLIAGPDANICDECVELCGEIVVEAREQKREKAREQERERRTSGAGTARKQRHIVMLTGDIYEDLELWYPKLRMEEAGYTVVVAGEEMRKTYAGKHGYPCRPDAMINDMQEAHFDGIILPGGFMPDKLRRLQKVKLLIQDFADAGKLVAAICHGGWMAISAGVYKGVRVTGSPGIKDDLENAGAIWEDAEVVVDRHFISSRKPDDLPAFCREIIKFLEEN